MKPDLSLYLIADIHAAVCFPFLQVIEEAILGGVTVVQLRAKNKSQDEFIDVAHSLRSLTRTYGVPFIINDYINIVNIVDADGVHLGQADTDIDKAREIIGYEKIIGISTHTSEEALHAECKKADYIGVGTVFPTASKRDIQGVIGLAGLEKIKNRTSLPVVGIGGIDIWNAESVMKIGVDGVALISGIMGSGDPRKAANELKKVINRYKSRGDV
jgi:thiamine-phosphate pyrophosphorylase